MFCKNLVPDKGHHRIRKRCSYVIVFEKQFQTEIFAVSMEHSVVVSRLLEHKRQTIATHSRLLH